MLIYHRPNGHPHQCWKAIILWTKILRYWTWRLREQLSPCSSHFYLHIPWIKFTTVFECRSGETHRNSEVYINKLSKAIIKYLNLPSNINSLLKYLKKHLKSFEMHWSSCSNLNTNLFLKVEIPPKKSQFFSTRKCSRIRENLFPLNQDNILISEICTLLLDFFV